MSSHSAAPVRMLSNSSPYCVVHTIKQKPDPDPPDPHFLGLPDPDPLVRGMDPDPSVVKQKL
jgi:hypothetical protein